MNTKGECSKQEKQPQNKLLRCSTSSEEVVICSKLTKSHQINILDRANQSVISWVFFYWDIIKLYLIFTDQVESIGKGKNCNNHCNNKILNI